MKDKRNGMRTLVMRLFARHAGVPLEQMELSLNAMQTLSALERQLHVSDDPEEIARWTMKVACEFYGADWCGFLQADLELGIWTPFWWYITSSNDKTLELTQEFETAASMPRWVAALRENTHIAIPDTEAIKESTPEEYGVYKRLRIRSVLAVPVTPRPVGFLAVRNPTRYCDDPVMLRMLAVVVLNAINQHNYMERLKLSFSPEAIKDDRDVLINLFGSAEIYAGGSVVREQDFKAPKTWRVLVYLLLHPRAIHPPMALSETLWPEEDATSEAANTKIRGMIYRIRQRTRLMSSEDLIISAQGGYRINPKLNIMTDIQKFDALWAALQKSGTESEKKELLKQAVGIYRGRLFESASDEHWLLATANNYSLRYIGLVNELLLKLAQANDYPAIQCYAGKSLEIAPGNIKAHYWLIHAMYHSGSSELARSELSRAETVLSGEEYRQLITWLKRNPDLKMPPDFDGETAP